MIADSIAQQAAEHVRHLIRSGALKAGEKLDQEQIAADLGVSRVPVREALLRLRGEGLIVLVPRRGAFVTEMNKQDIQDHYAVFAFSLGLAAERAAAAITPAQLSRLEQLNADYAGEQDPAVARDLDREFHKLINSVDCSYRLRTILQNLSRLSANIPIYATFADAPERMIAVKEHNAIVAALAAGDGATARDLSMSHLTRQGEAVLAAWDANESNSRESRQGGPAPLKPTFTSAP